MTQPTRRARSPHDKQLRKSALMDAARDLAIEQGVREVTMVAVSARVGLHSSALRRYFDSREELLLELTEEGWAQWRDQLVDGLGDARGLTAEKVADLVSGSLEQLPLFCDLLTHVVLSLEGSVRLERARRYKTAASTAYDTMTRALVEAAAEFDHEGAQILLTSAMSCAAYLFQLSRPTPTLRELYRQEPRWAHEALRFREQLTTLLTAVARGAQHPRNPPVKAGSDGPPGEQDLVVKGRYSAPRRAEAADTTRTAILDSARELYVREGYANVTVAQIATAAGVAVQTVYGSTGGKAEILRKLLIPAVRDLSVERALESIERADNASEIVDIAAHGTRLAHEAHWPLLAALVPQCQTEPGAVAVIEAANAEYAAALAVVAARLTALGALRPGLGERKAADVLWFYIGQDAWFSLVAHQHWSFDDAERWLAGEAKRALLAAAG
jgi:AcrR family transcriptional regulator